MVERSPGLDRTAVIIPALNEAGNLAVLLPSLNKVGVRQVVVGDNGSTDDTAAVASSHRASVAFASQRGYGAACYAAMEIMHDDIEFVIFVNADLTDDVSLIPALIRPLADDETDLVIGARVAPLRQHRSMSIPQIFGDRFATWLIDFGWDYRFYDLGPFRAIRRDALERIDMQDRAFGWTVEMQIRALQLGLRIEQLPVPYLRSPTPSRIGGTVQGVTKAGYCILSTWFRFWWSEKIRGRTKQ